MTYKTKQQLFNEAYRGLASQGWRKSITPSGFCMYKQNNGLKCAVGWCIPDEAYDPILEERPGKMPGGAFEKAGVDLSNDSNVWFLRTMQVLHDRSNPGYDMESDFLRLARMVNLSIPD